MTERKEIDATTADEQIVKLNQQTGKIAWAELQRFFASGAAIYIEPEQDLIQVAVAFENDDATLIAELMNAGKVCKVSDQQANQWLAADVSVWALVVAPWVLVQSVKD